ncbi:MAG: lactate utilization protein [Proteocatella sp.]
MYFKDALKKADNLKIKRTMDALEKNNINAYYAETVEEAQEIFKTLLEEGSIITAGGSMTAVELGFVDIMRNGNYNYIDREREGITKEEVQVVQRQAFTADYFVTGTNAITEKGELFNIDGNGNRVAAISFGPKQVIVVSGANKIVRDAQEARKRVKELAAPANAMRLDCNTPCSVDGICRDCASPQRVCCVEVLTGFQRIKDRIKVIIVNENLGF